MLGVGDKFPVFELQAVKAGKFPDSVKDAFETITNDSFKGKWMVVFFWPKDFTFVCPTEIAEFASLSAEFAKKNTVLLGASIDSEFVHLAWKKDNKLLSELSIPMLADIKRELSIALGILDREAGVSQRATYIVDESGFIRHISVNDLKVGRNPAETMRVLDALQTDELCPCSWKPGLSTIKL